MPNELNTAFKNTVSNLEINENLYIVNQVSVDILDPIEKCINKYKFHPSILLIKNRIKIQDLFSFYAIERNDMMKEHLKIDPKKATTGNSIPYKTGSFPDNVKLADIPPVLKKKDPSKRKIIDLQVFYLLF